MSEATSTNAPSGSPQATPPAVASDVNAHVNANTGEVQNVSSDWRSALNPDLKGYIETKGFKDPAQLAESYRQYEKSIGVPKERLLKLPENIEDAKAMEEIYGRLGRPAKLEEYKLEIPEGSPEGFGDWARQQFFNLGLSGKQASELTKEWNAYQASQSETAANAVAAKAENDVKDLKREWGAAHDTNLKIAQRAARALGVDGDTVEALESTLGYKKLMSFFHDIGKKIGEDTFVGSGSGGNVFAMTPEAAQSRIAQLKNDSEWTTKMYNNDAAKKDEWERLHRMAYPSS